MSRAGRRTKLSPKIQASICLCLQSGCSRDTAAAFAGISRSTLVEWLRRGRSERTGIYDRFVRACAKAHAIFVIRSLLEIRAAAETGGEWQAAAWRLERRCPQQYGRPRTRVVVLKRGRRPTLPRISHPSP
jgi:hypothetical protein